MGEEKSENRKIQCVKSGQRRRNEGTSLKEVVLLRLKGKRQ